MKHLHKSLLTLCLMVSSIGVPLAQTTGIVVDSIVTFRFLPGEEMFFLKENEAELNNLYSLVDKYYAEKRAIKFLFM